MYALGSREASVIPSLSKMQPCATALIEKERTAIRSICGTIISKG